MVITLPPQPTHSSSSSRHSERGRGDQGRGAMFPHPAPEAVLGGGMWLWCGNSCCRGVVYVLLWVLGVCCSLLIALLTRLCLRSYEGKVLWRAEEHMRNVLFFENPTTIYLLVPTKLLSLKSLFFDDFYLLNRFLPQKRSGKSIFPRSLHPKDGNLWKNQK